MSRIVVVALTDARSAAVAQRDSTSEFHRACIGVQLGCGCRDLELSGKDCSGLRHPGLRELHAMLDVRAISCAIIFMMTEDDMTLLDQWCSGDRAAGNELFRRHFEALYRFFEHKTDGEIDDLVQETFLACLRGRDTFRRQSSFRTYLFAIARHMLFGYWRRRASKPEALDFDEISVESLSTSPSKRVAKKQDHAALLAALRSLSLDQQILLEMFYWEELERDQLAEVFEVEDATIGSRLFRARQALQEKLGTFSGPMGGQVADFDNWARQLGRDGRL